MATIDQTPLPEVLRYGNEKLSPSVRVEIQALSGARPLAFLLQLGFAWIVMVGAIALAVHVEHWLISILVILVVATRHNVLGLLVHEQAHRLGLRGKYGDLFVNLFAAYPLLILTVEGYAQVHLAHHKWYFDPEKDPDFIRKNGEEWSFPKRPLDLLKLFLVDAMGINTLKLMRSKGEHVPAYAFRRPFFTPVWIRIAYYLLAVSLLTLTQTWSIFLLYWVVPILTVTQLIVRWGAICEHKYNLPHASVAESTPLIILSWWERLLLPNLNFAMHPYHHYFPGVAYCNLPKVHQIYLRAGLIYEQHVFNGYGAYLRSLIKTEK
jgi:fatty acid desaturase